MRIGRGIPFVVFALFLATVPSKVSGQDTDTTRTRPRLSWKVDAPLVALGAGLLLTAQSLDVARQTVPVQGLDPSGIRLSVDRNVLGKTSVAADRDSDYFLGGSVAYPMLVAFVAQPSGARWSGTLWRASIYAEAYAFAQGLNKVLKRSIDRPRPYNYLALGDRPNNPAFDVTQEVAFRSMPSGHAVAAFTGSAFAMTDHLLTRPQAGWQERVAVSGVGGFLAGMTATLRVEGGQHFPSDTFVGGLIGTASGVAVPLLHHYVTPGGRAAPMPSGRSWLEATAALVGGAAIGSLTAALIY